jgi:hypothetical protein
MPHPAVVWGGKGGGALCTIVWENANGAGREEGRAARGPRRGVFARAGASKRVQDTLSHFQTWLDGAHGCAPAPASQRQGKSKQEQAPGRVLELTSNAPKLTSSANCAPGAGGTMAQRQTAPAGASRGRGVLRGSGGVCGNRLVTPFYQEGTVWGGATQMGLPRSRSLPGGALVAPIRLCTPEEAVQPLARTLRHERARSAAGQREASRGGALCRYDYQRHLAVAEQLPGSRAQQQGPRAVR